MAKQYDKFYYTLLQEEGGLIDIHFLPYINHVPLNEQEEVVDYPAQSQIVLEPLVDMLGLIDCMECVAEVSKNLSLDEVFEICQECDFLVHDEEFTKRIVEDYAGEDYEDIMLDAAREYDWR